ncbi:MAG TPA: hypothetical protein VNI83_05315 [Vicinamibacterales bacterium]|nr:hypothetical protein [Vicinamibacterales bacterium]
MADSTKKRGQGKGRGPFDPGSIEQADGRRTEWRSVTVQRCERRTRRVAEARLGVYLAGGDTRRIKGTLARGCGAARSRRMMTRFLLVPLFMPRARRSRSPAAQLSADSRWPGVTATTTFRPSLQPATTTSRAAFSRSRPAFTEIASTHG